MEDKRFVSDHIRIALSSLAQKILESDRTIFGASANSNLTYGTLINRIIINFDDDFSLDESLFCLHGNEMSRIIRLKNEAIDILSSIKPKKYLTTIHNPNTSKYIKCLLETFARLPFIEREKLILKTDIIHHIETALKNQKKLQLLYIGNSHLITPICIAPSKEGTFQYLIGEENTALVSFRLSRIEKIRATGKASLVSESMKKEVVENLSEFGATFITAPKTVIKVRFTDDGLKSYEYSVIHRPMHVAIEENDIYVFNCSELQALYFFFRFAKDAEIIEPQSLRDKFRSLYRDGLNNYL